MPLTKRAASNTRKQTTALLGPKIGALGATKQVKREQASKQKVQSDEAKDNKLSVEAKSIFQAAVERERELLRVLVAAVGFSAAIVLHAHFETEYYGRVRAGDLDLIETRDTHKLAKQIALNFLAWEKAFEQSLKQDREATLQAQAEISKWAHQASKNMYDEETESL